MKLEKYYFIAVVLETERTGTIYNLVVFVNDGGRLLVLTGVLCDTVPDYFLHPKVLADNNHNPPFLVMFLASKGTC